MHYLKLFEDKFQGEVFICDKKSMKLFLDYAAVLVGTNLDISEGISHEIASAASFASYIAETYGEDILYLVSTGNNKVEELTGHTWEGLLEEWREYLKENYDLKKVTKIKNVIHDYSFMYLALCSSAENSTRC